MTVADLRKALVTQQDGCVILWPDCSWVEALEHAGTEAVGVE